MNQARKFVYFHLALSGAIGLILLFLLTLGPNSLGPRSPDRIEHLQQLVESHELQDAVRRLTEYSRFSDVSRTVAFHQALLVFIFSAFVSGAALFLVRRQLLAENLPGGRAVVLMHWMAAAVLLMIACYHIAVGRSGFGSDPPLAPPNISTLDPNGLRSVAIEFTRYVDDTRQIQTGRLSRSLGILIAWLLAELGCLAVAWRNASRIPSN